MPACTRIEVTQSTIRVYVDFIRISPAVNLVSMNLYKVVDKNIVRNI